MSSSFKKKMYYLIFFYVASLLTLFPAISPQGKTTMALPLYTSSRWIVDESGHRVKLACINWEAHRELALPEGLSKHPVDEISHKIFLLGFNCVRLSWPLFLATDDTLPNIPCRQSLQSYQLREAIAGVQANNPSIIDLPLIQAFKAVVDSLGKYKIMVILDNGSSRPGACCNEADGNGFFGDRDFDPDTWISGLRKMATLFNGSTYVVGMSLRNEFRGPRQNVNDWYRYMQRGAEAVHAANPNVLVIFSGLAHDTDLSFLRTRPLSLNFTGKIVFEIHMSPERFKNEYEKENMNKACGLTRQEMARNSGFLLELGWPLFVSEFAWDQTGETESDNRFINCFLSIAAELDLDWALSTLAGSYYINNGTVAWNQNYGILSYNWCELRNPYSLDRISALQYPFQGPGLSDTCCPYKVIFHPSTGLCVIRKSPMQPLTLGPCHETEAWSYSPMKTLSLLDTHSCLQAVGLGMPAKLGSMSFGFCSQWIAISDSKMHLATHISHDTALCLDVGYNNTIVTNSCKCLSDDSKCDPSSQWFKLVDSKRAIYTTSPSPSIYPAVPESEMWGHFFGHM